MPRREDYYWAEDLQSAYLKVPAQLIEPLHIRDGGVEISAWKQFLARYRTRALAFAKSVTGLEDATSRFIEIFYDNLFIVEQIKQYRAVINNLSNFDNWQLVTNVTQSANSTNSATGASITNTKDILASSVDNRLKSYASDDNSYVEALPTQQASNYPVNQYSASDTGTTTNQTLTNDVTNLNRANTTNTQNQTSKTGISNASEDYRAYLNTQIPELRKLFWSKFAILFI